MIGRFSIYVLIKFEIRLRLKVIYSNLLALNGTFRTVATQTPILKIKLLVRNPLLMILKLMTIRVKLHPEK
jgi:hypothetical protein